MSEHISFEDFAKLDLRVADILQAETVEGADKLLKLQVDIGTETRQIIAGIKSAYNPDDLVGQQIIILANLEPKTLMGEESQGMLLAANAEKPVLLTPLNQVEKGVKIT